MALDPNAIDAVVAALSVSGVKLYGIGAFPNSPYQVATPAVIPAGNWLSEGEVKRVSGGKQNAQWNERGRLAYSYLHAKTSSGDPRNYWGAIATNWKALRTALITANYTDCALLTRIERDELQLVRDPADNPYYGFHFWLNLVEPV